MACGVVYVVVFLLSLLDGWMVFVFFLGGVNLLFLFLLYSQTWISKILNRSTCMCVCMRKEVHLLRACVRESVWMCLCFCDSCCSVFMLFMFSFLVFLRFKRIFLS